ncbi:MAG TPA: TetR/AcrR family transcriptional regulator [Sinomonas sp.]|nr:TetR/AcrR family transcriptional regulator [Sinomonas sp.]
MREQILKACFELFARQGVRRTGVEDLVAYAGVAKSTFYSYVPSKEEAALAYLKHLYRRWATALEMSVAARGEGPEALLGVLDALDTLCGKDSDGGPHASLVRVLAEFGPNDPLGRASIELSTRLTGQIAGMAEAAGLSEPDEFARDYRLLLDGVLLSFTEGSTRAMNDAEALATSLIRHHLARKEVRA